MLAYDIILELNAPVAQLDRVTGYEPVGRGFESLLAHQSFSILTKENPQYIKQYIKMWTFLSKYLWVSLLSIYESL